jgi:hypothetical protein
MSPSIHSASVPVFKQLLGGLATILDKAQAHTEAKHLDPSALTEARLFPDMFPLRRQVQIACDFARGVSARLAGVELPKFEDNEQTLQELHGLIERSIAFIDSLDPAHFDTAAQRQIVTRPGTPKERHFSGHDYLYSYGLPQFFFHITTSYALLRHNGLEIGKRDYMGAY